MDRRELNEQVQGPPRELSKFSRRNKALFVFVTCVREGVAGRPREAQGGGPPSSEWSMTSRDLFNFLAATHGGSDGVSVDEKKNANQLSSITIKQCSYRLSNRGSLRSPSS